MKEQKVGPNVRSVSNSSSITASGKDDFTDNEIYKIHTANDTRFLLYENIKKRIWKMSWEKFPWRRFVSPKHELIFYQFKQSYLQHMVILPAIASCLFAAFSFLLNIIHFEEDRFPGLFLQCISLLISVAIITWKMSEEIPPEKVHIVAVSSVCCCILNLVVSTYLFDNFELTVQNNTDWVVVLVFICYVSLPMKYWKVSGLAACVMAVHMAVMTLQRDTQGKFYVQLHPKNIAATFILYASASFTGSITFCYMDLFVRNTFLDTQLAFVTKTKMQNVLESRKSLLCSVVPSCVLAITSVYKGISTQEFYRRVCKNGSSFSTVLYAKVHGIDAIERKDSKYFTRSLTEIHYGFDSFCKKYNTHLVKLVGSSFLVVCGAPFTHDNHAAMTVYLGEELQHFMRELCNRHTNKKLGISIGIHSGEVTCGIICRRQWHFDVLGPTVTIAQEIQRIANRGQGLISQSTRLELRDEFILNVHENQSSQYLEDKGINTFSVKYVVKQFNEMDNIRSFSRRRARRRGEQLLNQPSLTGSVVSYNSDRQDEIKRCCYDSENEIVYRRRQFVASYLSVLSLSGVSLGGIGLTMIMKIMARQELFLYLATYAVILIWPFIIIVVSRCKGKGNQTAYVLFRSIISAVILMTAIFLLSSAQILSMNDCISMSSSGLNVSVHHNSACVDPIYFSYFGIVLMIGTVSWVTTDCVIKSCILIGLLTYQLIIILYSSREFIESSQSNSWSVPPVQHLAMNIVGISLVLLLLERMSELAKRQLFLVSSNLSDIKDSLLDIQMKFEDLLSTLFPRIILNQILPSVMDHITLPSMFVEEAMVLVLSLDVNDMGLSETSTLMFDTVDDVFQMIDNELQKSNQHPSIIKVGTIGTTYVAMTIGTDEKGSTDLQNLFIAFLHFSTSISRSVMANYKDVTFKGGIHIGPVTYGVTVDTNPQLNAFGKTIDIAEDLMYSCPKGQIQVLQDVKNVFSETLFTFQKIPCYQSICGEMRKTYKLTNSTLENTSLISADQ